MYSSASNSEQYLTRTGSYSLRFRRSGDNSDLAGLVVDVNYTADKAGDSSITVQILTNEIEKRKKEVRPLQLEVERLNKRLAETLPFHVFNPLDEQRKKYGAKIQELALEISALKSKRKEISPLGNVRVTTFGDTFIAIAQQTLPADVFADIRQATLEALKKANQ